MLIHPSLTQCRCDEGNPRIPYIFHNIHLLNTKSKSTVQIIRKNYDTASGKIINNSFNDIAMKMSKSKTIKTFKLVYVKRANEFRYSDFVFLFKLGFYRILTFK